jgi:hypothetical protein
MDRQKPELADIFRRHGEAYLEKFGASVSAAQRRVMKAIEACRTAVLGGHVEVCNRCGHKRVWYNSCFMGSISLWGVGRLNDARSQGCTRVQLAIKIWLTWPSRARSVCRAAGMIPSAGAAERQLQWPPVFLSDLPECRFQ